MAHINIDFISTVLKRAVEVTLILPTRTSSAAFIPNYDVKNDHYYVNKKNQKYPLIILLHGYLNNHNTWGNYARVELFAEENNIAIAMISGENDFYVNKGDSRNFYDFIEYELKDFLYGTFPLSSKREDNFIAGLSMGGFGALYHGIKNPKGYGAIGAFSPAIIKPQFEDGDLCELIKKNKKKLPPIYQRIGNKDFLLEHNLKFIEIAKKKNIDISFEVVDGYDYEWRFWDLELENFIKWLPRKDEYVKESPRRV